MNSGLSALTKNHKAIILLSKYQKAGFKTAVLGGGAVRDMYANKPVSDYDIFLQAPYAGTEFKNDPNLDLEFLAKIAGINPKSAPQSIYYQPENHIQQVTITKKGLKGGDYTINPHIDTVWDLTIKWTKFQLIFCQEPPVDFINKFFDLGICKTYCDGKKIHFSEDFMTDMTQQTITICGQDMTKAMFNYVLSHHLPRIKKKYAGFRVVVADHNKQHIDKFNQKNI